MALGKDHYEKLIEEYQEKYLSEDEEGNVCDEQTAVNTASVFTDSFTDSLHSDEKEQALLLDNLIAELNKFAQEDDDAGREDYSEALNMARAVEVKRKRRLKKEKSEEEVSRPEVASEKFTPEGEEAEGEMEEEDMLSEDIVEEEAEPESRSQSGFSGTLEDLERMEEARTAKANRELLMKRKYVYQTLDSMIPEYEEELVYYLRDGEEMLLAEDVPNILRAFGANPTDTECRRIVDRIMYRQGGKLTFIDFLVILADQMKNPYTTEDVIDAFKMMDLNDNGELPVVILKEVLTTIGERLTEVEMDEMVNEGDPQKEGVVKYEEFVKRMDRNLYVAIPAKRKALIKMLRKEEKRRKTLASDEGSAAAEEQTAETEEDTLYNI